ncbi:FAD-dependent oxidoreductase [Bradyrhizobium sp. 186]|uniref:FAD-dependent oxidoreductase n=1 Tax=Bradyrhizobium sp. 186 TaxID=2782654 RepID=UPI002000947B|nr:FAD-dependent oxidoreductase [Bradyrhizobium sp. 186]
MNAIGTTNNPLRVAIIGSGPSGFYAAEALLQSERTTVVDVIERLPVPYGLVRYGVAPDHPRLKDVANTYAEIARDPRFSFIGNVEFGKDFTMRELTDCYHAVIFATGAATDRKLGIPGEDIQGSHAATSFVGWYNGHPDYRDLKFDLSGDSAIIIGQGNVAIDVCRILAKSPDELRKTDIAAHALDALAESRIREIHLIGRRGPVQSRFTSKELRELGQLSECDPFVDPNDLLLNDVCKSELADVREPARARNFEAFKSFASRRREKPKCCRIHFFLSPKEARGEHKLEELILERTRLVGAAGRQEAVGTGQTLSIKAGLMIRSVGYSGRALEGIPFDNARGTIPNKDGRLEMTSPNELPVYVVGWIKRGPTGIIGTNRADSMATVATLLADLPTFESRQKPGREAFACLLAQRATRSISFQDWEMIDQAEKARGTPLGKPREKFTRIPEMLAASTGRP